MKLISRTRPRHRLARALALTSAAVVATSLAAVPANAGGDGYPQGTTIRPGSLPRGEDTRLLHTEGRVIVDGDRRIRLDAAHVGVLGRHGRAYIAATSDRDFQGWRLLRVRPDGSTKVLMRRDGYGPDVRLDDTGFRFVVVGYPRDGRARLTVRDSVTGEVVRSRSFPYAVDVLDYSEGRMVLSEFTSARSRTFWWNAESNSTGRISKRPSYFADIAANRLGQFLGDPYQGGCQRVVKLSRPGVEVWRSCRDRVFSVSPDARRMVTGHILTDGPGPRVIQVRAGGGRVLETYRSEWFGFMEWETNRKLLLAASGPSSVAAVRCTLAACERASKTYKRDGRDPWEVMRWAFPPN